VLERFKNDDRYDSVGLRFIASEAGVVTLLFRPDAVSLSTGGSSSPVATGLSAYLRADIGIGNQVVVPVRVPRNSTGRSEYRQRATNVSVHQRDDALITK
jgi:hypothetical protein